jgi:ribosomal protein S18 acetylase RimI-like enzyme
MRIRQVTASDVDGVVALWEASGLTRPWNDPRADIARKLGVQPELFLVGEEQGRVVASAMGGYDGHRGHINYLAVAPEHQGTGLGKELLVHLETLLLGMGCPKINIQVRLDNGAATGFYAHVGYAPFEVHDLGKRLVRDENTAP